MPPPVRAVELLLTVQLINDKSDASSYSAAEGVRNKPVADRDSLYCHRVVGHDMETAQSRLMQIAPRRALTTSNFSILADQSRSKSTASAMFFAYGLRKRNTRLRLDFDEFPTVGKTIV